MVLLLLPFVTKTELIYTMAFQDNKCIIGKYESNGIAKQNPRISIAIDGIICGSGSFAVFVDHLRSGFICGAVLYLCDFRDKAINCTLHQLRLSHSSLILSPPLPLTIKPLEISHPRYLKYFNMAPRHSGQTSIFGVVFFVSKSPLGIKRKKKN